MALARLHRMVRAVSAHYVIIIGPDRQISAYNCNIGKSFQDYS